MDLSLQQIIAKLKEVNNLPDAAVEVVEWVTQAIHVDACAIYVHENNKQNFRMLASAGMTSVPNSLQSLDNNNLVSLVASRAEPLNLEDATTHPRYSSLTHETSNTLHSFLGVPIIERRQAFAVIVAQRKIRQRFSEHEEALLVTLAIHLATLFTYALAIDKAKTLTLRDETTHNIRFSGISGAPGIAIGTAVVINPPAHLEAVPFKRCLNIEEEKAVLLKTLQVLRRDIKTVRNRFANTMAEADLKLFDAYSMILKDATIENEIIKRIEHNEWAPSAVSTVILKHARAFQMMEDEYFRERANDIKDLGSRIINQLLKKEIKHTAFPQDTILLGDVLSPAVFSSVPMTKVRGMASVQGSYNSHIAIVARAIGITTIVGIDNLPLQQMDGMPLIIDGNAEEIIFKPDDELLSHYKTLLNNEKLIQEGFNTVAHLPCKTLDDYHIPLMVNTGLTTDIRKSVKSGAEGVGLYRTEIPFLMSEYFPTEEEQHKIYRQHLEAYSPRPVTMRTLDIGGDKNLDYFPIEEDNPFLGWRGIRITLDHPEIFLTQVRAMLKASSGLNNLNIMLPMIVQLDEVQYAKQLIQQAYDELTADGWKLRLPPVGVMIEVPAAVYLVESFAKMVDFISVGTNDLIQYLLAVDRNNPRVADRYQPFHPAVLHALADIAQRGQKNNIPVYICGELAGDPLAAILLVAMGFSYLSMSVSNLPRVKSYLRQVSVERAKICLEKIMQEDNAQAIQQQIQTFAEEMGIS